jgi:hypothetical protein
MFPNGHLKLDSTSKENEEMISDIDALLDNEKLHNKSESWNKLNKTTKIQKLHQYAEKYGKEQGYSTKEVKLLKQFFSESLDRDKLQKTKDVIYDKNTRDVTSIPGLVYNPTVRHFTLRVMDAKRISTLKSLTPKRVTEKKKTDENDSESKQDESSYTNKATFSFP